MSFFSQLRSGSSSLSSVGDSLFRPGRRLLGSRISTCPVQVGKFPWQLQPGKNLALVSNRRMSSEGRNRLAGERSPYLLQHAANPVHWYPWGEEAFTAARESNKLIFLSVGYSTCHWCHVMEKESFENEEVAKIMNTHFINVKVDREERPDVDKVYMSFVNASVGGGGWPMSVFLTPSLHPIFGGTYFPPEDRMYGRPGFKTLLKSMAKQWETKRERISESGRNIVKALEEAQSQVGHDPETAPDFLDEAAVMRKCFDQLETRFDGKTGGFSKAPKFPQPVNLNFLFHYYAVLGPGDDSTKRALKMATFTLEMMAKGGINDHIFKGFARYSTDGMWHVPHFEKMLYDQAQLCGAYAQAFVATKEQKFARVARDIVEYVSRDLSHPEGGMYSAEDADSAPTAGTHGKKEGAFCVWTMVELERILDANPLTNGKFKRSQLFAAYFNCKPGGNVKANNDPHGELTNQNVLTVMNTDFERVLSDFQLKDFAELEAEIDACKKVLFEERLRRPRPHLDDKILTSWNGLMISGLCSVGCALGEEEYVEKAARAAKFIKKYLWDEEKGLLHRSVYNDEGSIMKLDPPIHGFIDDYSFLIRGLLDLYEATFDTSWLEWALRLQESQNRLFWDTVSKGYFLSPEGDADLVLRIKDDQDGAEPAANSVAVSNLQKLAAVLERPEFNDMAKETLHCYKGTLTNIPLAMPEMVKGLMLRNFGISLVIVTGDPKESVETRQLIEVFRSTLLPQTALVLADGDTESVIYKNSKVVRDMELRGNVGKAYVCKNFTCYPPVSSPQDLLKLLLL